ncbi:MAG: sugar transferase, partial [Flavobacteriales bacterium]
MKRIFDIISSLMVLLIGLPFFLLLALAIVIDSRGGIFYRQIRVGRNEKEFYLYKFRSMVSNADKKGQLTVGASDSRITRVGKFIRKFKLDEFPQLINVIKGEMSIVGPRPEVPKYVKMYSDEQRKVLSVRPGLTDYASLEFINENEILGKAENPEQLYIQEVMPAK